MSVLPSGIGYAADGELRIWFSPSNFTRTTDGGK